MKGIIKNIKGKDIWMLLLIILAGVLQVYFDVKIPAIMSKLATLLQTDGIGMESMTAGSTQMLICVLLSLGIGILDAYLAAKLGTLAAMRIRAGIFDKVMGFSMTEVEHFGMTSLITRCTDDVTQIQNAAITVLIAMVKAPVTAVWTFVKIMHMDASWMLTMIFAVAIFAVCSIVILILVNPLVLRQQRQMDELARVDHEHISGIQVIQAFNARCFHRRRFTKENDALSETARKSSFLFSMLSSVSNVALNAFNICIFLVGAYSIQRHTEALKVETFSNLISFSSYALLVMAALVTLVQSALLIAKAQVCYGRIREVMDTEVSIRDGVAKDKAKEEAAAITFDDVSFRYPQSAGDALSHISFEVKKGETVAVIGATGAGKTTALNLIPRLYDAREGSVLVDGRDVRDYPLEELRMKIGYIPQKSILFTGTVAENIDYGNEGKLARTIRDIERAANIGQANGFIKDKEGAYQHQISEGGKNFSGGQRQRLTISRAICRDPEIYLFDDSFSALDFQTDRMVREKLRKEAGGATVLIVAQRIGTIKNADKIIVMNQGEIVAAGTHYELMKNCEIYQEIAATQLSDRELRKYGQ